MRRTTLLATLTIALCAAMNVRAADDGKLVPSITVVGRGEVQAQPNMANVMLGVTTEGDSASEAVKLNNERMEQLLAALRKFNVADKHVQTSNFNVAPRQTFDRTGQKPPKIVGYTVTNQVSVKVLELSKLGEILDAVVTAGSNQIHGVSFSLADDTQHMDQAREKAMDDARRRAELYAKKAGVTVGKPLLISEQGGGISPPVPYPMAMRGEAMAAAVPVSPGEQTLSAQVTVTYAIAE